MFGRKHFAPEGEGAGGGSAAAVVVPAAVPAAAPVVAPAAAVVPAVAAVAPAAATPAVDPTTDPSWIKARLEREAATVRARTLAELGVTDVPAAKAALASANAAAEATKTAEQRALEATGRVTALSTENERLASITREHAGRMIGVLTPEQQVAIRALAPDTDPAGQLQAIGVLGPTWAAASAATAAAVAAAAPPAATAPAAASTAPGATAPTGGPTTSPPDHRSVYQASRSKNPFAAAAYGLEHASEVYRPKA